MELKDKKDKPEPKGSDLDKTNVFMRKDLPSEPEELLAVKSAKMKMAEWINVNMKDSMLSEMALDLLKKAGVNEGFTADRALANINYFRSEAAFSEKPQYREIATLIALKAELLGISIATRMKSVIINTFMDIRGIGINKEQAEGHAKNFLFSGIYSSLLENIYREYSFWKSLDEDTAYSLTRYFCTMWRNSPPTGENFLEKAVFGVLKRIFMKGDNLERWKRLALPRRKEVIREFYERCIHECPDERFMFASAGVFVENAIRGGTFEVVKPEDRK